LLSLLDFSDPRQIVYYALAFVTAIIVHEFSHGLAAKLLGDDTAERAGRLTFNPAAHLSLFGTLAFIILGFGWAKPVPVNPNNFKNKRRDNIIVSLAGIIGNFILILLCAGVLKIIVINYSYHLDFSNEASFGVVASYFLVFLMKVNAMLMVFNLIPIPPLDGAALLESGLKGKAYYNYKKYESWGQFIILFLFFASYAGFDVFGYILNPPINGIMKLVGFIFNLGL
jgi:Zn-dependent protease